jgi:hypothetical protein
MLEIFAVVAAVPCAKCLIVNLLIIMAGLWKKRCLFVSWVRINYIVLSGTEFEPFLIETGLELC